jgi:L-ascorbate metabolism protein UlaG (beta-lactamase superfamily)
MKHEILFGVFVAWTSAALAGCTPAPAESPVPPTAPPPTNTAVPTLTPAERKVKIYYEENAQVELIGPAGRRVLIDVYSPTALSSPATAEDILLTTHAHSDHVNTEFYKPFPGQQLFIKAGTIKLPDVIIQGIAAGHNASDTLKPEYGSNYIFLVEMGGLRIAHFGDIGQDALTADQLTALGQVDIAITQFSNSYSDMSAANKKGFNLMDQVKPRLIIPTHNNADAAKVAGAKWPALYSDQKFVSIGRGDLTDQTRILFMGTTAKTFGKMTNASPVDW